MPESFRRTVSAKALEAAKKNDTRRGPTPRLAPPTAVEPIRHIQDSHGQILALNGAVFSTKDGQTAYIVPFSLGSEKTERVLNLKKTGADSKLGTHKTAKTRLWPWLEALSVRTY